MTDATLPADYYDCKTIEQRWAWLREQNRKRCEDAAARKIATKTTGDDESFEFDPPVV